MRGEEELAPLFDAYRRFAVHNAIVAEALARRSFASVRSSRHRGREKEWPNNCGRGSRLVAAFSTLGTVLRAAVKVPFGTRSIVIGRGLYKPALADPPRPADPRHAAGPACHRPRRL